MTDEFEGATPTDRHASQVNKELTGLLADAGERMGLKVVREYAIQGGRLDVVWLWDPPVSIPGVDNYVPVVGFEIESSWRTRKHVKGDLLNLQDAGVALGVIVLAGADPRDEALRRFAETLVKRPGPQVLVWTEKDVRSLAAGEPMLTEIERVETEVTGESTAALAKSAIEAGRVIEHDGKFRPLWLWLTNQPKSQRRMDFTELEHAACIELPPSSRKHLPHWYGYQGSAVARAIIDAGWKASAVDLNSEQVTLSPN